MQLKCTNLPSHTNYIMWRGTGVSHTSQHITVCPTETEGTTDTIDLEEIPGLYKCLNHLQSSTNLGCLVP